MPTGEITVRTFAAILATSFVPFATQAMEAPPELSSARGLLEECKSLPDGSMQRSCLSSCRRFVLSLELGRPEMSPGTDRLCAETHAAAVQANAEAKPVSAGSQPRRQTAPRGVLTLKEYNDNANDSMAECSAFQQTENRTACLSTCGEVPPLIEQVRQAPSTSSFLQLLQMKDRFCRRAYEVASAEADRISYTPEQELAALKEVRAAGSECKGYVDEFPENGEAATCVATCSNSAKGIPVESEGLAKISLHRQCVASLPAARSANTRLAKEQALENTYYLVSTRGLFSLALQESASGVFSYRAYIVEPSPFLATRGFGTNNWVSEGTWDRNSNRMEFSDRHTNRQLTEKCGQKRTAGSATVVSVTNEDGTTLPDVWTLQRPGQCAEPYYDLLTCSLHSCKTQWSPRTQEILIRGITRARALWQRIPHRAPEGEDPTWVWEPY